MKKELEKRIMLELIERKYTKTRTSKFIISENDFRENSTRNEAYSTNEIRDILFALEKSSKGKIKLLSIEPKNDRPKNHKESEWEIIHKGVGKQKYPDYFDIVYTPLATEDTISLSREKGLCRIVDGKTICYPISGERYEILSNLGKRFVSAKDLAGENGDPQKVRSQIGYIRKLIEKKLLISGVIESSLTGNGYRIGKNIKIIHS